MIGNMGPVDRTVRIIAALAIAYVILDGTLTGAAAVVFGILGVAFLVTGFVSTCPLYSPFGISTRKRQSGTSVR